MKTIISQNDYKIIFHEVNENCHSVAVDNVSEKLKVNRDSAHRLCMAVRNNYKSLKVI